MVEKQTRVGNFTIRHLGQNHYVVYPHPDIKTANAFTLTGWGTVDSDFIKIDFHHRIVKLVIIQLDSSYAAAYDQLSVSVELDAGRSVLGSKVQDVLFKDEYIKAPIAREVFGEGFEYEPREWTLNLEGMATNLVIPLLYIQKLEAN